MRDLGDYKFYVTLTEFLSVALNCLIGKQHTFSSLDNLVLVIRVARIRHHMHSTSDVGNNKKG